MAKKRLSVTSDGILRKKVTKRKAGMRWGSVVEKVLKEAGGNQGEIMPMDECGGHKTNV